MRTFRIGTRGSKLAVTQTEQTRDLLKELWPSAQFEIETITTRGDLDQQKNFSAIGAKGIFVKELDDALLAKRIDFAVRRFGTETNG